MNFAQALERSCQAEREEESPRQLTLALPPLARGATTDGAVSLYQGQLRCPKEKRGLVLGSLPCEREGDRRRPVEGFPPTNSAQALGRSRQAERAEESPRRCTARPPLARGAAIDRAASL